MPELLLELFSEEIPARMQRSAAYALAGAVATALVGHGNIVPGKNAHVFYGPRRIALVAYDLMPWIPGVGTTERGPRVGAPDAAIDGFLRKHDAKRTALRQEGDYWYLEKTSADSTLETRIAATFPTLLRRFPWPKSMRWGGSSTFAWVRPLRRILCLLDGKVVPFDLRDGADDGHGLASGNATEGHRFHAPGPVAVDGFADYQAKLYARRVILDAAERRRIIAEGIARLAAEKGLRVVEDPGLLDEITGLTEWPVPLLGRIEPRFMDLPPEVMRVSMRVNQRYFALRNADGSAAPFFAFVAGIEARDGGAEIARGNARVLAARFADARHFWDLDRKATLESRLPALERVTFHAKLGTQAERARRIAALARRIAEAIGADADKAERAGLLAKTDLATGMVGEFPELQGIMGGYYAAHDGEDEEVAIAIRDQYMPKGADDAVPTAPVSVALGLADRLDQLAGFFAIGEKPTGSGDPFALRRAALGVIRLVVENRVRVALKPLVAGHAGTIAAGDDAPAATPLADEVFAFIADRLRVQLRAEGARHDILAAVFAAGADDDLVRALARTDTVAAFLATPEGADLLAAYRRAANILRIEGRKDGPHEGATDPALLREPAEAALAAALDSAGPVVRDALAAEGFPAAMAALAALRGPVDGFFNDVLVNDPDPGLRRNRLRLLNRLRAAIDAVADFSRIEG